MLSIDCLGSLQELYRRNLGGRIVQDGLLREPLILCRWIDR